jgi:hypothetical protein
VTVGRIITSGTDGGHVPAFHSLAGRRGTWRVRR